MSKFRTIDIWNEVYGKADTAIDYAGRVMKKSACGDSNSAYQPTLDHVRPLSQGGKDVKENIIICNRITNEEKSDNFPHWETNNKRFKGVRVKGNRQSYDVVDN